VPEAPDHDPRCHSRRVHLPADEDCDCGLAARRERHLQLQLGNLQELARRVCKALQTADGENRLNDEERDALFWLEEEVYG
jgi:hypothetical protein